MSLLYNGLDAVLCLHIELLQLAVEVFVELILFRFFCSVVNKVEDARVHEQPAQLSLVVLRSGLVALHLKVLYGHLASIQTYPIEIAESSHGSHITSLLINRRLQFQHLLCEISGQCHLRVCLQTVICHRRIEG